MRSDAQFRRSLPTDNKISSTHCVLHYCPPRLPALAESNRSSADTVGLAVGDDEGYQGNEGGGHFELQDTSSFGTFVNGSRVPAKGSVCVRDRSTIMLTMRHIFRIQIRTGQSPYAGAAGRAASEEAQAHLEGAHGPPCAPTTARSCASALATAGAAQEEPAARPPPSLTKETCPSRNLLAAEPSKGSTAHTGMTDDEPTQAGSNQQEHVGNGDAILAKAERAMSLLDDMICKGSTCAGSSVSGSERGGVEHGRAVEWGDQKRAEGTVAASVGGAAMVEAYGVKPKEGGGSSGEIGGESREILLPISSNSRIFSDEMASSPRAAEPLVNKGLLPSHSLSGSPSVDLPRLSRGDGPGSRGVPSSHLRRLTGEAADEVGGVFFSGESFEEGRYVRQMRAYTPNVRER